MQWPATEATNCPQIMCTVLKVMQLMPRLGGSHALVAETPRGLGRARSSTEAHSGPPETAQGIDRKFKLQAP
eukprot:8747702-Alexandrium_andersonii.AAC.1